MTQLTQTLNNYSLKPLTNFFVVLFDAFVEARTRQAAYETVRYLRTNRDFAQYSEMELFDMVMNRTLDNVKKKG